VLRHGICHQVVARLVMLVDPPSQIARQGVPSLPPWGWSATNAKRRPNVRTRKDRLWLRRAGQSAASGDGDVRIQRGHIADPCTLQRRPASKSPASAAFLSHPFCVLIWVRSAKSGCGRYRLQFAEITSYTSISDYYYFLFLLPLWLRRSFDLQRGRVLQLPLPWSGEPVS
jgi:hypothetical protein